MLRTKTRVRTQNLKTPFVGRALSRGFLLLLFALQAVPSRAARPSGGEAALVHSGSQAAYGKIPLYFEPNRGQFPDEVLYSHRGRSSTLFLTASEAVTVFSGRPARDGGAGQAAGGDVLRVSLVGSSEAPLVQSEDPLPGRSNYLIGPDPSAWTRSVPHSSRVRYREVYPGIDVVYHGVQDALEYDFVVSPGADPGQIRLRFEGCESLSIDDQGSLIAEVGSSRQVQPSPLVYQEFGSESRLVEGQYRLVGDREASFELGAYDRDRRLVIDPLVFVYSTHLGGNMRDEGNAIAVDADGNAYVAGTTFSDNFPLQNPFQAGPSSADVFVTKLSADGSTLIFSTYIGGSSGDIGRGIAVDPQGNVYVVADPSSDFPTTPGALDTTRSGASDGVVFKLSPQGDQLLYSTFLGGGGNDNAAGIVADSAGNAYVTGSTGSSDFPVDGFDESFNGNIDAYVAKLNPDGTALVYSTYLGGSGTGATGRDDGLGIAVNAQGQAYVTGVTGSADFPTTPGVFQTVLDTADAFVAKLAADGNSLVYSTLVGGGNIDTANNIAIDSGGNAYITGITQNDGFPVKNAFQPTRRGMVEGFVSKLNSSATDLVFSSFLGGSGTDRAMSIAVDGERNVFVGGYTASDDFPLVQQLEGSQTENLSGDAFVTKIHSSGSSIIYSTFIGGTGQDQSPGPGSLAVDREGSAYVTGFTRSDDFPTHLPFQPAHGGGDYDAFVAKLTEEFTSYFAQFANGGGLTSEVVLTNPSLGNRLSGYLETTNTSGDPLTLNVTATGGANVVVNDNRLDFALPSAGSITIATDGLGQVIPGTALVKTNGEFGGVIRFTLPGVGTTGVASSNALSGFITPVRRTPGGINTGVAIQNIGDDPVTLDLVLRDQDGEEVASAQIVDLAGRGQRARFIDELFMGVGNDFQGTMVVQVVGVGLVAATSLEQGPMAGQFTTLPVTPLN